ncbi:MAG: hypothetical protein SXV54_13925 [Chloroflexota bacterium]|nr:hypothetical protein [Chloroflexota bacterium]
MALVLTIGGVNRTSVLQQGSLSIEHRAEAFISVCSCVLIDEDHDIAISVEDTISVVDGATTFFSGRVVDISYDPFTSSSRLITLQCQDNNWKLVETVIDDTEEFSAMADSAIIDALFDEYLPAVDSETYVDTIQDPMTIDLGPCTLRGALSQISTRTGGYYYIDFANKLHYFSSEGDTVAWWLSDDPDQVDSFSYFDLVRKVSEAATRLDGVYVVGDGVEGWRGTHGAGDRCTLVRDNRITTATGVNERGDAILAKYGSARVRYEVSTYKAGLTAGQDVRFICAIYDVDDTFTVHQMTVRWDVSGTAYYDLILGDSLNPSLIGERLWLDTIEESLGPITAPRLPTSSKGWTHDIVFYAPDNDTVMWGLGTITLADGTTYNIVNGSTGNISEITYIFLDLDTSTAVLQTTTDSSVAVGSKKILLAWAKDEEVGTEASFFVFGGSGQNFLVDTANIAGEAITTSKILARTILAGDIAVNTITAGEIAVGTITTNEIAANTIEAGNIAAGAIETDELAASAVTAAKISAGAVEATKLKIGDWDSLFSDANGLLLLGPGCQITPTSWTGTRGQVATISGAFHQEGGPWPESRGLVVERYTMNYELAPRMIDDDSSGLADGWTIWDGLGSGGSPTTTVVVHPIAARGWLQRLQYTGASGDVNDTISLYDFTAAGSFSQGNDVTVSIDTKGQKTGCTFKIVVEERDAANVAGSSHYSDAIAITDVIQRVKFSTATVDADCDRLRVILQITSVDDGDTLDIYIGAINIEKLDHATSFCCGALDWCSWSGTEDDSTSIRLGTSLLTPTTGSIDASAGSILMWFKAPTNVTLNRFMWSAGDINAEFDASVTDTGTVRFRINGITRCESAGLFPSDDWHLAVFTWNASGDVSKLYLDGALVDSGTCGGATPTLHANLGIAYSSAVGSAVYSLGGLVDGFATLGSVLTDDQVAALYARNAPLVDAGTLKKPGIYILDGLIKLASSPTGARTEIDGDGVFGYNAAEATFKLNNDGSGQIGASSEEPITWDTSGVVAKLKATQVNVSQNVFNDADGALLLGPFSVQSSTLWRSSREHEAVISGAFRQEQGFAQGTKGIAVDPATTNLCINPNFELGVAGWSGGGSNTVTQSDERARHGDYGAKCTYNNNVIMAQQSVTLATSTTYRLTCWVWIHTGWSGGGMEINPAGFTGSSETRVKQWTPSDGYNRWFKLETELTTAADAAGTIQINSFGTNPVIGDYLLLDDVQYEVGGCATSYFDGTFPGCSWTGAEHASTSTRTATEIDLDTAASVVSEENEISLIIRVRVPYDATAVWPQNYNYVIDYYTDGSNHVGIAFDDTSNKFKVNLNGAWVLESSAQTFVAGDEILLIVTLDYTNDDYNLYVNDELEGTYSASLTAPTVTKWNIGSTQAATSQSGLVFSEVGVTKSVLTPYQAAAVWTIGTPLVDMGSTKSPGIYILDGLFKIASSVTGARIEVDADGIAGYDGTGTKQFYLQASDGKALCGGGDVILDDDGIILMTESASDLVRLTYNYNDSGTIRKVGHLSGRYHSGQSVGYLMLRAQRVAGDPWTNGLLILEAVNTTDSVRLNINSNKTIDVTGSDKFIVNALLRPGVGASDPTSGVEDGCLYYRTDTHKLRLRANSAWVDLN